MVFSSDIKTLSELIRDPQAENDGNLKPGFEEGLEIYRNNYLFSLIDCLRERYTSIFLVLEEENFNFFARRYIYTHPSRSANIDDYGEDFAEFIGEQEELTNLGYLKPLGDLDNFILNATESPTATITLASGILELWQKLQSGSDLDQIEINENLNETIHLRIEEGEIYLISR